MKLLICLKKYLLTLLFFLCASQSYSQKKTGIALSGGGALGYAHIGVLRVLEENNIPISIVSGTSMGAIIGSLYAVGYSAKEIEEIILGDIDFFNAINDENNRYMQTMGDKLYSENEVFELFLREYKDKDGKNKLATTLGGGLIKGTRIDALFDKYLFEAGKYKTFKDLPRAFAPVATDIDNQKATAFTDGSLSQAVKASFCLPVIFAPVTINGVSYIDGFITRKYPVIDAFNLGADNVILVTMTGENNRKIINSNDKSISLANWSNLLGTLNTKQYEEQRKLASVVIDVEFPDGFKAGSFKDAKKIIKMGEDVARANLDVLRQYAVNNYQPITYEKTDSYTINKIEIRGTKNIPLANKVLNLKTGDLKLKKIAKAVSRLANYEYFMSARYWLKDDVLVIDIEDRYPYSIGIGVGYNSDYGINGGMSFTSRHVEKVPVIFKTNLNYNNGIDFKGHLRMAIPNEPSVNFFVNYNISDALYDRSDKDGNLVSPARRDLNNYGTDLGLLFYITPYISFSTAYRVEYYSNKYVNNSFYGDVFDDYFLNVWVSSFNIDTRDSKYSTQKGFRASVNNYLGADPTNINNTSFYRLDGMASYTAYLGKGFSLQGATYGGFITGDNEIKPYYMQLGGMDDYGRRVGMLGYAIASDESYGESMWLLKASLIYTFFEKFHITTQWEGGWISDSELVSLNKDDFVQSVGGHFSADMRIMRFQWGLYWNFSDDKLYSTTTIGLKY